MKNNRSKLLDGYGRALLEKLSVDPDYLPGDYNPVAKALAEDPKGFVDMAKSMKGYSKTALSKVFCACQMRVYDVRNGPDGDGKPKTIRRHWYDAYKVDFAHPLAHALGEEQVNALGIAEVKNDNWEDLQSDTYGFFVDSGLVTYRDIWVEDASRKMQRFWETLFEGCNILVCVEKNGLFDDFLAPAQSLGAKAVYSGAGKSSKAGIEKVLRDCFNWREDTWSEPVFSADNPLIVLHVSDHDFDGEAVIGPTFAEQARRYTPHILEARVGVKPEHILAAGHRYDDKWYDVKIKDAGYVRWAEDKALMWLTCPSCEHTWISVGIHEHCPDCGSSAGEVDVKEITPHGFEVEALRTRDYRALLVDALLQVLPFNFIVERLRDECKANSYDAAEEIKADVLENNQDYQRLLAELARFDELNRIKSEFENRVRDRLSELGQPHIEDFRDEDNDPTFEDFQAHVRDHDYASIWRPFSESGRTASLVEYLRENEDEAIQSLIDEAIEF